MEKSNTPCYDVPDNHFVVCLCGSTKFKEDFENANRELTLKNHIIVLPGCFMHADCIPITEEQKEKLDFLHKKKIDMADCVFIVNTNNYIGSSTKSEIEYAEKHDKPIYWMYQ